MVDQFISMDKWSQSYYCASKIRLQGSKSPASKDPYGLHSFTVYAHGHFTHYYFCCAVQVRPGKLCDFCIRKDVIARELRTDADFIQKVLAHKHKRWDRND